MTKFQKQMLTIAAAGALTAVTALPAMAFENEFHGAYILNSVFSNYNNGTGTTINPAAADWKNNRKLNNYIEQRARIQYIAKASDDLKLVTHLEIDSRWGGENDGKYSNTTDSGNLDADGVAIEVKHVYLDFNLAKNINVKTGVQGYKDAFKGIFLDADVPAIITTSKMGSYTLGLGYSRFAERNTASGGSFAQIGHRGSDLLIMDNSYALSKDTKVGFSYYWLMDASGDITATTALRQRNLHTFGITGETKLGNLALSGFFAKQYGYGERSTAGNAGYVYYNGMAANVAANMKFGQSAVKVAGLYASGNNGSESSADAGAGVAHRNGWMSAGGLGATSNAGTSTYNESGSMIIIKNAANSPTNTDTYLRKPVTNIALAALGFNHNFSDKLNLDTNVLFAWAPSSFDDTHPDRTQGATQAFNNASDFMGTEINTTVGYKLYKNLTLQAQAAYMVLGGYYKNSTLNAAATATNPADPYTARLQARYSF